MPSNRSLPYILAKGFLSLLGGLLGYLIAAYLVRNGFLDDVINMVYLSLVGLLMAYLFSTPLANRWAKLWRGLLERFSTIPPQAVLAGGVGVTIALIITVLLNTVLESVPGFTWYWSLIITLVLVTASTWFFVANRQLFTIFQARSAEAQQLIESLPRDKVIDTSAIIDGRVAEVIEANFIDGKILIPRFILLELQNIADSSDPLRRGRGRRGLEVLDKLIQQKTIETLVIDTDFPELAQVDEKLVKLCQQKRAALITTDYNLNRVAALQSVRVLNVNQLANAIKPVFLPGERLSLHIAKEGREPGQGLAYLEDGTMVVIEDADNMVGSTVDVQVTSHLQTNMGRMIFARLYN